ncbi:hypothetical protein K470DRAFT_258845 [Piedraia hortae CBS 480.64]|uniref:F-box domain-containing protein n=1 Tax=Piedraia hortae CBS 480.64 TaxID=1314780 RepID=A0A6A7BYA7_9PEZI|nr:hypothetical protein K470DRAFT_258845 [Piedraia hortae CBS 480.64]
MSLATTTLTLVMASSLSTLPFELLQEITQHLDNNNDLKSLALTNKLFQLIAESSLYHSISFQTTAQLLRLLNSLKIQPTRAHNIRTIQVQTSSTEWDPHAISLENLLTQASQLRDLKFKSPVHDSTNTQPLATESWTNVPDSWLLSLNPFPNPPLNPNLTILTLRLAQPNWSCHHLSKPSAGSLFTHPTIIVLNLSHTHLPNLPQKEPKTKTKTPLKKLILSRVELSAPSLHAILSHPLALEYLYIGKPTPKNPHTPC